MIQVRLLCGSDYNLFHTKDILNLRFRADCKADRENT